jgi:NhaA family Na+:H+ antiporter
MTRLQSTGTTPFERLVRPFQEFIAAETSGGIVLVAATIVALIWANSPWAESYFHLWHIELTFGFAGRSLSEPLHFWINDGLMAVFFLLVGLEIKRELLVGELASVRRAALPIAAAVGGMVVPAAIYCLFDHTVPMARGWGIPMATDIAFALGVITLLGDRVPPALRIFLAALAIVDDLGAVLVIALFYTDAISLVSLAIAGVCLFGLIVLNRVGVRHPLGYAILGVALWLAFLQSGVHATVAGVLLAMTIPARQRIRGHAFLARGEEMLAEFRSAEEAGESTYTSARKSAVLHALAYDCERVQSPMIRFEHALAPWVAYVIMPVFALANAGVALNASGLESLVSPLGLGIVCGLCLGKPIGIFSLSWLVTRLGWASRPANVSWRHIFGAGVLGGIGFTMSLFIAGLAFGATPTLEQSKIGILTASLLCGVTGAVVLSRRK